MVTKSVLPENETKAIFARIETARDDRQKFASVYNSFIDLARPHRPHVKARPTGESARQSDEQDDLFDTTLQDALDDFASDMNDEFTPMYKPWTKHVPVEEVQGRAAIDQIQKYADSRMRRLYDRIRESNFEEASQEFWSDIAISPSGVEIGYSRAGQPIPVEHVPIHELLIRPGPFGGVDDRWRERCVQVAHLDTLWPDLDWTEFGATPEIRRSSKKNATVIIGGFRDWTKGVETWNWHVLAQGKVLHHKVLRGPGSCPLIVARPNVATPTAYCLGPGVKCLPPARTLNELNYLALKRQGRLLDPPVVFYDDGLLNPEGGIDNGTWLPASETFKVQELGPDGTAREVWFTQEDLRMMIKRALFQDKPYQRGDTPPTAAQWLSEEASAEKRKSFPRARLHDEFVLPVIRRFEWIMRKRGEIEKVEIEGKIVNLNPISPLSRTADIQDAQMAIQMMESILATMPNAAGRFDESATLTNIKNKLGSDVVVVLSDQEYQKKRQQEAAIEAQARGAMPNES